MDNKNEILIADDNCFNIFAYKSFLSIAQMGADQAINGLQAQDMVK